MRIVLLFLIVAILQLLPVIGATQSSVVDCKWPCLDKSAKCVVTSESVSCQITQGEVWILSSPTKAPSYTGASASNILSACIPAPNPQLSAVMSGSTINSNQTIIQWPPGTLRRPLDSYLGNCGHKLYCSSAGKDANQPVCRERLSVGSMCYSSNQCHAGYCNDGVCHPKNESSIDNSHSHSRSNGHNGSKPIQILASILGIVGALLFACIGYFVYRHLRRNHNRFCSTSGSNASNSPDLLNENIAPAHNNAYKEEQFASDFLQDTHHNASASVFSNNNNVLPVLESNQSQADIMNSYNADSNNLLRPPPSYRP
ncbi:hypothetical protein [Parasitella parasitica]|uniref:Uncharacterized protein n=1 Tax=Parasitella parasitica TaxID=35722 RepID=A0A0B7MVQ6_9FUNG|nr:hypothetical protein [Parasitella parasitica]